MFCPVGQLPDQPGVNRPKGKPTRFRLAACAWNSIQNPADLGAREIRVDYQAGFVSKHGFQAVLLQCVAHVCGAPVLPDYGVTHRLTSFSIPHYGCFALVGNTDGGNILCGHAGPGECFGDNRSL